MSLSWVARRRGHTYCAPACGRGCTHAEFLEAEKRVKLLCKKLGSGWRPRVHENLGWHYNAVSPCGYMTVTENGNHYTAYFNREPTNGTCVGIFTGSGYSPSRAVERAVREAREKMEELSKMLMGFSA